MRQSWDSHETVMRQSWDSHETVMRQSWDSLETVYYSTPVTGLADMSVLVCSVRWSVTPQQGGHKIMACLSGKGHGKKVACQELLAAKTKCGKVKKCVRSPIRIHGYFLDFFRFFCLIGNLGNKSKTNTRNLLTNEIWKWPINALCTNPLLD